MSVTIPYVYQYEFEYATIQTVSPLVRRVTARNPSGFTFHGTGTYIIGHGDVAVVDPGPMIDEHIEALKSALAGETITHILITHTHMDHSPAAAPLKQAWNTQTYGFGPHGSGKAAEGVNIEAGGDMDFTPDVAVKDGDVIEGNGWTIECVYTPGHTSNHMCFALLEEKALFTGDHVMGWSTTIIPPPDGDVRAYLDSLRVLLERPQDQRLYPTHGAPVDNHHTFVRALLDHRLAREAAILQQLADGPKSAKEIVTVLYADVRKELHKPAARSVLSHLRKLHDEDVVELAIPGASTLSSKTVWVRR